jgi:hypothetical protein
MVEVDGLREGEVVLGTKRLVEKGSMRLQSVFKHVWRDVVVLLGFAIRLLAEGEVDAVHLVASLEAVVPLLLPLLAVDYCHPAPLPLRLTREVVRLRELLRLVHFWRQIKLWSGLLVLLVDCNPAVVPEALLLEEEEVIAIILYDPRVEDVSFEIFLIEQLCVGLGAEVGALEVAEVQLQTLIELETPLQVTTDAE